MLDRSSAVFMTCLFLLGTACASTSRPSSTTAPATTPSSLPLPAGVVASAGASTLSGADLRRHVLTASAMRRAEACPPGTTPCVVPSDPQLVDRVLEAELEALVLREYARRSGIEVAEKDIDEAVTTVAARNGMAPEAFLVQVKARGLSVADYRDSLARELLVGRGRRASRKSNSGRAGRETQSWRRASRLGRVAEDRVPRARRTPCERATLAGGSGDVARALKRSSGSSSSESSTA